MSYDIELVDPVTGQVLLTDAPHEIHGGTYEVAVDPNDPSDKSKWRPATRRMHLNVTYNYSAIFHRVIDKRIVDKKEANYSRDVGDEVGGIRVIYGLTGAESIPYLKKAIDRLGDDVDEDYWKATEGNAKRALCGLLAFALLRPDGVWEGD